MGYALLKLDQLESEEEAGLSERESGLHLCAKGPVLWQDLPDESLPGRLVRNLSEALFPARQAPLALTSRPIAVADPMAEKRGKASSILSFFLHAGLIALVIWLVMHTPTHIVTPQAKVIPIMLPYIPVTQPSPKVMGGGGGGGEHQPVEVKKGRLPEISHKQVVPPQILRVDHPKLAVQPTVVMPKQMNIPNSTMPNMGAPQSPQIAVVSQGTGSGSGFGSGGGGGIGFGQGAGVGSGSGGGYGGGVMSVGGGVAAPQLIHSVQPEFTNAARQAHYQGIVAIQLIVDSNGNPENISVLHHLGMGLDQKAIEAVQQYKFRPAMYQGHAVPVRLVVEVNFRLY
jgi:TonB family protein